MSYIEDLQDNFCEVDDIDDYIEAWHDNYFQDEYEKLHEALGFTHEEYKSWVEDRSYLKTILANRGIDVTDTSVQD